MKKIYLKPEMEICRFVCEGFLANSVNELPINNDEFINGSETLSNNDSWNIWDL